MIYRNRNLKPLIDVIVKHESGGDPNIVWGGIARKDRPSRPLTDMTIGQVLAWQDRIDPHYPSEASGKFQIMEDTLRGLWREAGMSLSTKFTEATQDRLGIQLMRRRGLDAWIDGEISTAKFANSLAKEWASLPVVSGKNVGKSYYAGDGLNKALTSPKTVLTAIQRAEAIPDTPTSFLSRLSAWWRSLVSMIQRT